MQKHVLVTGGAGFIGSNLVDELILRNYKVTVLDDLSTGEKRYVNPKAKFVKGSVAERKDVEKCFTEKIDAVCHLAANASIVKAFADPEWDIRTNVIGTMNLLTASIARGVPRFLYASSIAACGQLEKVPVNEKAPLRPLAYYGITKGAGEQYAMVTGQRKDLKSPLAVTAFRMFNVYGRRQSLTSAYQGVVAIFIGNVRRGEPINIFGSGKQTRDYVHVSDVARAWADAIENKKSFGQVLNIGSGRETSVNQLLGHVLAAYGHDPKKYPVKRHPARLGDAPRSLADISKAKRILAWTPQVKFEDGIKEVVAWARETLRR